MGKKRGIKMERAWSSGVKDGKKIAWHEAEYWLKEQLANAVAIGEVNPQAQHLVSRYLLAASELMKIWRVRLDDPVKAERMFAECPYLSGGRVA